jgi:hypothetical protein
MNSDLRRFFKDPDNKNNIGILPKRCRTFTRQRFLCAKPDSAAKSANFEEIFVRLPTFSVYTNEDRDFLIVNYYQEQCK